MKYTDTIAAELSFSTSTAAAFHAAFNMHMNKGRQLWSYREPCVSVHNSPPYPLINTIAPILMDHGISSFTHMPGNYVY
jgi:hypothetical protein